MKELTKKQRIDIIEEKLGWFVPDDKRSQIIMDLVCNHGFEYESYEAGDFVLWNRKDNLDIKLFGFEDFAIVNDTMSEWEEPLFEGTILNATSFVKDLLEVS